MNLIKIVRYNLAVRLTIAACAGAIIGLAVFAIGHVTGRNLYLIIGAISGMAAVFALDRYVGTTQLTEVTIAVPQVSSLKFVVNSEARLVAWQFYIETVTRVSTQPLSDDDGFLREALTSLYGLFATIRETLKASRPSVPAAGRQTVEHLAVTMLNHHLRPFLSKWHPRLREFEVTNPDSRELTWPDSNSCRAELRQLQEDLVEFALGFAQLAGVHNAKQTIKVLDER